MKKITIDELKEMMRNGKTPEYVIYKGITYFSYLSKNDYSTIMTPNSDNIVTCDYFSTIYYQDHYLTANQTDILIPQPEILDPEEKEYLRNVIKPFRNEIQYIDKNLDGRKQEYIRIHFKHDVMNFKSFEQDTMYKGMELYTEYTLEELGL